MQTKVVQPLPSIVAQTQGGGARSPHLTFDPDITHVFSNKMFQRLSRVRVARSSRYGILTPARALSYPQEPLTSPISELKVPARAKVTEHQLETLDSWNPADSSSPPTNITQLENGLRVASQEAFGQYTAVGGR